ncbi:MAG TPA: winged helix-turn-helix domain-containing protein [Blastocatellia bacterium]|jgi:TolB-like protein/DNA-binding winged helix-turn-helix (wHTH) protein/Flp pilus assembly protein TadD
MNQPAKRFYEFGHFHLDTAERLLLRNGEEVSLTPKVFDLLLVLVENSGHILEKDELMRAIWPGVVVEESNLARNVSTLRKALGESPDAHPYIETIPWRGYRFMAIVKEMTNNDVATAMTTPHSPSILNEPEERAARSEEAGAASPVGRVGRRRVIYGAIVLALLAVGGWALSLRFKTHMPIESLAVLPFASGSADPQTAYLSDGITESLINSLSQLPNLRVIARTTAFRYKDQAADLSKIGRDLNVKAALTGKVLLRGDTLIVQADLVNVADGAQLWGRQYTRKLSDIFSLQAEVATDIAEELRSKLTGEEKSLLARRYTNDAMAYQLYQTGRFYWDKRTEAGFKKAIDYFRQATQRDPHYALAYAGLADAYIGLAFYNYLPAKEAMTQAKASALEAQKFDDTLAEAHASLAHVKANYDWDWVGAESEFKRAIALNPRYTTARQWYAIHYLTPQGRLEEALAEMSQARDIDPVSLIMNSFMGATLYFAGRRDQAVEQCFKTLELDPNFGVAHWHLGLALVQEARFEEAIAELNKAGALSGGSPLMKAALGYAYAVSGRRGEAMKILAELQQHSARGYASASEIAAIYAGLGERDQAVAWLDKAAEERAFHLVYLKVRPEFAPLRSDPRFEDLLRRIGLAQ